LKASSRLVVKAFSKVATIPGSISATVLPGFGVESPIRTRCMNRWSSPTVAGGELLRFSRELVRRRRRTESHVAARAIATDRMSATTSSVSSCDVIITDVASRCTPPPGPDMPLPRLGRGRTKASAYGHRHVFRTVNLSSRRHPSGSRGGAVWHSRLACSGFICWVACSNGVVRIASSLLALSLRLEHEGYECVCVPGDGDVDRGGFAEPRD
jgi:hypothetical protein